MLKKATVLAIETSCDETSVAIVSYTNGEIIPLSNIVSSQVKIHAEYGGVVPNLAAREHVKNIIPVLEEAFRVAGVTQNDLDAIAVTQGPGLIPALLVGTSCARTLAHLWRKPLLGIHHIEGHIYANAIGTSPPSFAPARGEMSSPQDRGVGAHSQFPTSNFQFPNRIQNTDTSIFHFPVLALVVSGGHTQLIFMRDHFEYEIIGETQDDAVGEAFDKTARILGLGYPGGPAVSRRAAQVKQLPSDQVITSSHLSPLTCHLSPVSLPRPMLHSGDYNFSFSGLKTAVLYAVQKYRQENTLTEEASLPKEFVNALCAEFEQASVDVLVYKTIKASRYFKARTVVLTGGVSANTELRKQLGEAIESSLPSVRYLLPPAGYSTDNAGMIASAGAFRFARMSPKERENAKENWRTLETRADLTLTQNI